MFWNIEGLQGFLRKEQDFNFEQYDIIGLVETFHLSNYSPPLASRMIMFDSPAVPTHGRPSGGIALFQKNIFPDRKVSYKSPNVVAVMIHSLLVVCAYFPPKTAVSEIITETLNSIKDKPCQNTIVYGDFNCRLLETRGDILVEALALVNLHLVNDENTPTYKSWNGESAIDLVFASEDIKEDLTLRIEETVERKHQRLITELNTAELKSVKPATYEPKIRRIKTEKLENEISNHKDTLNNSSDVEGAVDCLYQLVINSKQSTTSMRKHGKPWFDYECKRLKTVCLAAINSPQYNDLRKRYKQTLRQKRQHYEYEELMKRICQSRARPWILFPKKTACVIPPITMNAFSEYFRDLLMTDEHDLREYSNMATEENSTDFYNLAITNEEVENALRRSSRKRATGPDNVAIEVFKDNKDIFIPIITKLFNMIFDAGRIPEKWRKSYLRPFYKGKGNKQDPSNYRGISLTSHLYKLLTAVISNRLTLQCLPDISSNQYGFLPHRSCEMAVAEILKLLKGETKPVYAVFIDFRKCFDNVRRTSLISELIESYNIRGKLLRTIYDILKETHVYIDNSQEMSGKLLQNKGVIQGDSCSPLLFVLFANRLLKILSRTNLRAIMYADDLVCLTTDPEELQRALQRISLWCADTGMEVNQDKTFVMKFRRGGRFGNNKFYYNRMPLKVVNTFTYLGIGLTPGLSFRKHFESLKAKTAASLHLLRNIQLIPLDLCFKIFTMKIIPIATYCLRAISSYLKLEDLKDLDRIKAKFLKAAVGLPDNASNTFVFHLCSTNTLVHDLIQMGFEFPQPVLNDYFIFRENRNFNFVVENYTGGPAFIDFKWTEGMYKCRSKLVRATWHGFHFKICSSPDCYEASSTCMCMLCESKSIDRYHLFECKALQGMSMAAKMYLIDT